MSQEDKEENIKLLKELDRNLVEKGEGEFVAPKRIT